MDGQKEEREINPLSLPPQERTLWLVSRLRHVEALLMGMGDVQKLLIGLLSTNEAMRGDMRAGLTELAMSLPPKTMRTLPIWSALSMLEAGQAVQDDAPE